MYRYNLRDLLQGARPRVNIVDNRRNSSSNSSTRHLYTSRTEHYKVNPTKHKFTLHLSSITPGLKGHSFSSPSPILYLNSSTPQVCSKCFTRKKWVLSEPALIIKQLYIPLQDLLVRVCEFLKFVTVHHRVFKA